MKQLSIRSAVLTLIAVTFSGCAKTDAVFENQNWCWGNQTCVSTMHGDTVVMEGGNLHEGGVTFCLIPTGKTDTTRTFRLEPYYPTPQGEKWVYWPLAQKGQSVIMQFNDTTPILRAISADGTCNDIAYRYQGNLEREIEGIIARRFEGTYNDSEGREYMFFSNYSANINGEALRYSFEKEFDTPSNILRLSNGEHIALRTSKDSLYIYSAYFEPEVDEWCASDTLKHALVWASHVGGSKHRQRWDFVTTRLLTSGELFHYSIDELRQLQHILMHTRDWGKMGETNLELVSNVIKFIEKGE